MPVVLATLLVIVGSGTTGVGLRSNSTAASTNLYPHHRRRSTSAADAAAWRRPTPSRRSVPPASQARTPSPQLPPPPGAPPSAPRTRNLLARAPRLPAGTRARPCPSRIPTAPATPPWPERRRAAHFHPRHDMPPRWRRQARRAGGRLEMEMLDTFESARGGTASSSPFGQRWGLSCGDSSAPI